LVSKIVDAELDAHQPRRLEMLQAAAIIGG
jgi:hypothetical protein